MKCHRNVKTCVSYEPSAKFAAANTNRKKGSVTVSQVEEIQCCILESHRTNTVLWDFGHLLQRVALLPDLTSHLAKGLLSNSQHITARNPQRPHSSLCLLGLGQVELSLQLLAVLALPGAVYPSAAASFTQSISLSPNPQRWGYFLHLVSAWQQETWVFYQ